jgi:hypothetical protein
MARASASTCSSKAATNPPKYTRENNDPVGHSFRENGSGGTSLVTRCNSSRSSAAKTRARAQSCNVGNLVLLQVDQQLAKGARLGVAPSLAEPFGSVEVGKTKDVQEFDARRGRQGYDALAEGVFHLLEGHGRKPRPRLGRYGPGRAERRRGRSEPLGLGGVVHREWDGGSMIHLMQGASDPNWLLSSTAQSAAALVAIVGGFLAGRLLALNADRDAAHRRLSSIETELTSALKEEERVSTALDAFKREQEERIARQVEEAEERGSMSRSSPLFAGASAEVAMARIIPIPEQQEERDLTERKADATWRVRQLEAERDQIKREIASLRVPDDLRRGFLILVFFAISALSSLSSLWRGSRIGSQYFYGLLSCLRSSLASLRWRTSFSH